MYYFNLTIIVTIGLVHFTQRVRAYWLHLREVQADLESSYKNPLEVIHTLLIIPLYVGDMQIFLCTYCLLDEQNNAVDPMIEHNFIL